MSDFKGKLRDYFTKSDDMPFYAMIRPDENATESANLTTTPSPTDKPVPGSYYRRTNKVITRETAQDRI